MKCHCKFLGVVFLFILTSCMSTPKINTVGSLGMTMTLNEPAYQVMSIAMSQDGKYGVSTGFEKKLHLWDLSDGKRIHLLTGPVGDGYAAAFSSDDKQIVSCGWEPNVRLWDTSSGKEVRQLIGHKRNAAGLLLGVMVRAVAFSPDNKMVVSGSLNETIVWDVQTGNKMRTFPTGTVFAVRFTPDGKHVLTGGDYITLWNIETGEQVKQFQHGRSSSVQSLDVSSDGRLAVTGGMDGIIKIWDIASGQEIKALEAHKKINGVTSINFTSDGKYILSGGGDDNLKLWDVATGKEVKRLAAHGPGVLGVSWVESAISRDGKKAISGGLDAAARLWDIEAGEELAVLIGFADGEWLVITREGYFNASEKGGQYLSVQTGGNSYSIDKFYDVFYRPDIVAARLRGNDISGLITLTMQDAIKNPPPLVDFTSQALSDDQQKARVCYKVTSSGGGIGEVRLFHNGKLIQSDGYYKEISHGGSPEKQLASLNSKAIYDDMRSVSIKNKADLVPTVVKPKGDIFEDCREVQAVAGENEVSVSAFNNSNSVQSYLKTIRFHSAIKEADPHLYILAIGIDRYKDNSVNLKYAVKDAKDIEEKLKTQAATLYKPRNIHYDLLADGEATKAKITEKINDISGKIKPQDSFILFAAGHGVLIQNQYYLLTQDYSGTVDESSMISSNEIVEASKKIKSLSQLFIFDTCHAGGVDTIVSGLYDARMSVLARKMGLHIYASASDKQSAMDGYKGNGLFTHVLLDGLNNNREADKNKEGKVTVVGLGEYSKKATTNISREIGHSQTPLIINFGKDSPIYQIK